MALVAVLTLLSVGLLSRRVGASHEFGGRPDIERAQRTASRRGAAAHGDDFRAADRRSGWRRSSSSSLLLWLLSDVLLPFVAGMALAYLLDPLADRLERLGVSRLVAALADHHAGGDRASCC